MVAEMELSEPKAAASTTTELNEALTETSEPKKVRMSKAERK